MGEVKKFRKWRKYNDYRIETECRLMCPYAILNRDNGQLFCYGRFKEINSRKIYTAQGLECDKVIEICFNENFKLIKRGELI